MLRAGALIWIIIFNLFLATTVMPTALAASGAATSASLEPRQVAKSGDVEIPEGMHLVRDRTGLRWLLPIGMESPPEREIDIKYFHAREEPQRVGSIGSRGNSQVVLNGPMDALDTIVSREPRDPISLMMRLPKAFAELMRLEKAANLHAQLSNDLLSLGEFAPNKFVTFKLPFIPIPEAEMQFAHVSDYASSATRKLIRFQKAGVSYVRFFIHPNYVGAYADLIERYGISYHYDAMTTSSPRSLVVVDPSKPEEVHWVKVSIHKEIDGSVRINSDKKARRAIIMSEAIANVPAESMAEYRLRFMLEPAALQPPDKVASTIHREVASELLTPERNTRWIPAFVLQNTGENAISGLSIKDMATLAGERPVDFIRERIVRPLLRSYLSMGLIEGLPGELHTQNFYYKLKRYKGGWLPTGDLMFKDNDGFRFDTELAMRQGRRLEPFAKFDDPFTWGKFSNAIGTGSEGVAFLGSWYYKLIRNVNGFETLAGYLLRAINSIDKRARFDKDKIQRLFDDVAAEEAARVTGFQISEADYGFGQDKGLNKVLGWWRTKLAMNAENPLQKNNSRLQVLLEREWRRLDRVKRVSPLRRSIGENVFYLLHSMPDGALVIEARTSRPLPSGEDPVIGFAMVEAADTTEGRSARNRLNEFAAKTSETRGTVSARFTERAQYSCEILFMAVGQ